MNEERLFSDNHKSVRQEENMLTAFRILTIKKCLLGLFLFLYLL